MVYGRRKERKKHVHPIRMYKLFFKIWEIWQSTLVSTFRSTLTFLNIWPGYAPFKVVVTPFLLWIVSLECFAATIYYNSVRDELEMKECKAIQFLTKCSTLTFIVCICKFLRLPKTLKTKQKTKIIRRLLLNKNKKLFVALLCAFCSSKHSFSNSVSIL